GGKTWGLPPSGDGWGLVSGRRCWSPLVRHGMPPGGVGWGVCRRFRSPLVGRHGGCLLLGMDGGLSRADAAGHHSCDMGCLLVGLAGVFVAGSVHHSWEDMGVASFWGWMGVCLGPTLLVTTRATWDASWWGWLGCLSPVPFTTRGKTWGLPPSGDGWGFVSGRRCWSPLVRHGMPPGGV